MPPATTFRVFLRHALIAALVLGSFAAPGAAVAALLPVTGWAWSDYVGWISFSSANAGSGGGSYGVYENSSTGALSGYAWSSNLGWITFNSAEVSGCPSGACPPSVNLTNGAMTGWARALSYNNLGGGNGGGWDGWIALSGIASDGTPYGVTQNLATGIWSGYAWGSSAMGAIGVMNGAGVSASFLSDLTAGSASPTSAITSAATTFSATITNIGTGSTGAGFTNLFQFDDNADHTAIFDTRTDTSPAVATGGTDVSQVSYTFSTSGTWYVRACADNDASFVGTIAEPQPSPNGEFNNCGAWTEVTVALPQLSGTFSASPATIDPGQPSTLTWNTNADSCVGQGFSTGVGSPADGSAIVTPTTPGPNSYQIICSKPGYEDLYLATTVTVISVTASVSAKPSCISGGSSSSKISWSVLPATQIQAGSCTLSGPGLSSNPLSVSPDGSAPNASPQTASVPSSRSTYTISCTTTGGAPVTKSVVVDVSACWTEF